MASQVFPHPYFPRNLSLPHYVPNNKPIPEILGLFFSVVGVVLVVTWLYSGTRKHLSGRYIARTKICWFVSCCLIHIILEGYFAIYNKTLAGHQTYLAQMWKEYGKGDSRYVSGETCMVCVEGITAFFDGPVAGLAALAFLFNHPSRFFLQLIVSCCQLYGDTMYFSTEYLEGFPHNEVFHPLHFWFYFIFLNGLWIIIPFACIVESAVICIRNQGQADRNTSKQQSPVSSNKKSATQANKKPQTQTNKKSETQAKAKKKKEK